MFNWFKKKKKEKEELNLEKIEEQVVDSEDEQQKINDGETENQSHDEVFEEALEITDIDIVEEEEKTPDKKDSNNNEEKSVEIKDLEFSGHESESDDFENEEETDSETIEDEEPKKEGLFKALFSGLNKTRKKMGDQIDNLLNNYAEIDDDLYEEIEDILITADVGMDCTMELIENLKEELVKRKVKEPLKVKEVLRDVMAEYLTVDGSMEITQNSPSVVLVIGVNGAGKTTSIGKIAYKLNAEGKKVVLAAADTFRAAAIDQLKVWAERAGVGFVAHSEGSDPSAVIFDGIKSAQAKKADVLICDTAGRLHNKVNLMNELNKMFRIIEREYPEASKEVLLVLDATTGQNAINQAEQFLESAGITGLIITKLDGTAKGGFVFAIRKKLGIPVKLIGVGEKIEDLQKFNATDFANAVLNL